MVARLLPVGLALAAVVADRGGQHGLAFYLLVASVPAAAVGALVLFGRLVELPGGMRGEWQARFEALLAGLGLAFLLLAAAVRGQAPEAAAAPTLAASALVAALVAHGALSVTALAAPSRPKT
jgi:hypothetical protein